MEGKYKNVFGHCPKCHSAHILMNTSIVLTSYPPQYHFKCQECDYEWTDYAKELFPDYAPIRQQSLKGWECPKCGGVFSPSTERCLNCTPMMSLTPFVYCDTRLGDSINGSTINTITSESTKGTITLQGVANDRSK